MHVLNNQWTLWLHLPNDPDWSINSYKKIYTFNTLEDCIILLENMKKQLVEKCMLFIMKSGIKPIWEDPKNCKGGCFSYKINTDIIYNIWKKLNYNLIGESLIDNDNIISCINGISISPKKNFCIIKLWISDIKNLEDCEINKFINDSINNENNLESNLSDPFNIHILCDIEKLNVVFKLHNLLY